MMEVIESQSILLSLSDLFTLPFLPPSATTTLYPVYYLPFLSERGYYCRLLSVNNVLRVHSFSICSTQCVYSVRAKRGEKKKKGVRERLELTNNSVVATLSSFSVSSSVLLLFVSIRPLFYFLSLSVIYLFSSLPFW